VPPMVAADTVRNWRRDERRIGARILM